MFKEERLLEEQARGVGFARYGNGSRGRHAWLGFGLTENPTVRLESESESHGEDGQGFCVF